MLLNLKRLYNKRTIAGVPGVSLMLIHRSFVSKEEEIVGKKDVTMSTYDRNIKKKWEHSLTLAFVS